MGMPIRLCSAIAPFSVASPAFDLIFLRFLIAYTVVSAANAIPNIPSVFLLTLGFIMYLFAVVGYSACVVAVIYHAWKHR